MDWRIYQPPSGNTGAKTKVAYKYPPEILAQLLTDHLTCTDIDNLTRLNSTPHDKVKGTVCQDWLRYTCHQRGKLNEVTWHLQQFWPQGSFLSLERGRYGYSGCWRNMYGVEVWFSEPGQLNSECFSVDIPGQALAALTLAQIVKLNHMMVVRYESNGKRADPAIDIFDSLVSMDEIFHSARQGDIARAQTWRPVGSGDIGNEPDWSIYFGSRKSDKFVRIYDKAAQQGLLGIEWLRIEAELKDSKAHQFVVELAALHDLPEPEMLSKFKELTLSAIRGTVEFIQRGGLKDRSIDSFQPLPWWQKLMGDVEAMSFRSVIEPLTIDRSIEWLVTQVAVVLATVRAWFFFNRPPGAWDKFLADLLLDGENRFQTKHKLALGFG